MTDTELPDNCKHRGKRGRPLLSGLTAFGGLVETIQRSDVLELLQRQSHRCALTGRPLTPETASLDHRIPIAAGGDHAIGNLQIIHRDANAAKGTMAQSEFVALCWDVVEHLKGNTNERAEETQAAKRPQMLDAEPPTEDVLR